MLLGHCSAMIYANNLNVEKLDFVTSSAIKMPLGGLEPPSFQMDFFNFSTEPIFGLHHLLIISLRGAVCTNNN